MRLSYFHVYPIKLTTLHVQLGQRATVHLRGIRFWTACTEGLLLSNGVTASS